MSTSARCMTLPYLTLTLTLTQVMAKVMLDEQIGSLFHNHASEARRLAKTTGGMHVCTRAWTCACMCMCLHVMYPCASETRRLAKTTGGWCVTLPESLILALTLHPHPHPHSHPHFPLSH